MTDGDTRAAAAPPPEVSSIIAVPTVIAAEEVVPSVERVAANDAAAPFACTREQGCSRLNGGECPGGKGC